MKLLSFLVLSFTVSWAHAQNYCETLSEKVKQSNRLEVRIVLGYKDTRPARFVGDRHERIQLISDLTRPCHTEATDICGFKRDSSNADYFSKQLSFGDSEKVRIDLFLVHSSVGTDDQSNRSNPFQAWQSAYAKKAFEEGLQAADILLYNGHSRFGGGPDFSPPQIRPNKTIDLEYYKRHQPGLKLLLGEGANVESSLLGLYSCEAVSHFARQVQQKLQVDVLASDTIIHHAQAMRDLISDLSHLLSSECLKASSREPNL